jgi:HSP20 family protein
MSHEIEPRQKQSVEKESTRPGPVFRPDVDVVESAEDYLVTADLPGVDEQHVRIHLEEGVLSIDASLATLPEEGWRSLYREYHVGGYHREFRISDRIDADRISAAMRDGVLELRLPKLDRHKPRTIQVQAG